MADYVDWPGLKGSYRYWFLTTPGKADSIQAVSGNYMFVMPSLQGGWVPVYVGVADDLSNRIPNHDRWNDAINAGATAVMAHKAPLLASRQSEEQDLIAVWQPVLNVQHRGLGSLLSGLGS